MSNKSFDIRELVKECFNEVMLEQDSTTHLLNGLVTVVLVDPSKLQSVTDIKGNYVKVLFNGKKMLGVKYNGKVALEYSEPLYKIANFDVEPDNYLEYKYKAKTDITNKTSHDRVPYGATSVDMPSNVNYASDIEITSVNPEPPKELSAFVDLLIEKDAEEKADSI